MHKELAELINKNIPEAKIELLEPEKGDHALLVTNNESLHAVVAFLKDNSDISFNALQVISGVDWLEHIEVNYIFANFCTENPRQLILKVRIQDRVKTQIDSIVDLYPAANFQERECYDMLGVHFNSHPDLRRILCVYDWEGYPLRKDYMAPKTYGGMEVFPEEKMNMNQREYIVFEKEKIAAEKAKAASATE